MSPSSTFLNYINGTTRTQSNSLIGMTKEAIQVTVMIYDYNFISKTYKSMNIKGTVHRQNRYADHSITNSILWMNCTCGNDNPPS